MSKIQMRMLSWACAVRNFGVERDVNSDPTELTNVRHDHDERLVQLTAVAAAAEAITTQSYVQTTEVRRPRLALDERPLEPTICTTHSSKLEISGDDVTFVLSAFGVNDESLATTDCAMATVLTVLAAQFIVPGLASSFLELLRNASRCPKASLAEAIRWDVRNDAFERGQWFYGRIHEERSEAA